MRKLLIPLLLLLFLFPFDKSCAEESNQESSYWEKIKKKVEEVKSDDKEVSKQAQEWIEEDIKKIGDWEYKVLKIKHTEIDELETHLTQLGNDRWECFWIEKKDKDLLLLFKRPKISYLQKIPKGELFKMLNSSQGE
jgi:thioredoxin-related protein